MSLELWIVYLAAAVGLSLTPGPNGLLALTHGARFGASRAAFTSLGGVTGCTFVGIGALLAITRRG